MTIVYTSAVDGSDADSGADWTNANETITGSLADLAAAGAGPHINYVDSAGSYSSGAAITHNAASGQSVINISVNRSTGAWEAGASETVGVNSAAFSIANAGTGSGQFLCYVGLTLVGNSGNNASNGISVGGAIQNVIVEFDGCTLTVAGSHANIMLSLGVGGNAGSVSNYIRLRNCTINTPNSTGSVQAIRVSRNVTMTKVTIGYSGANKRSTLFGFNSSTQGTHLELRDCDLSGFNTTSGAYFDISLLAGQVVAQNCKVSATPSTMTGTWINDASSITLILWDSGDTHNVIEYHTRLGSITEDTATYLNGGAEFDGSPISWRIVTTADCTEHRPFKTPWFHAWVGTTGSALNFDLEILRDSATDYTDRELWGEFETLEDASFPLGTLTSTRNAQPFDGTGVDLTNSAATWTESMTNDNEMRLRATRTPAEKGLARARLFVAVASETLYLNPQLRIGA